jgi:hypothetical protein
LRDPETRQRPAIDTSGTLHVCRADRGCHCQRKRRVSRRLLSEPLISQTIPKALF